MSKSSLVSKITQPICLAYICSCCHFPVISIVTLNTTATTRSKLFTPDIIGSAATAENKAIRRIDSLYKTKGVMDWFSNESVQSTDSSYVYIHSDGPSLCPHCGRVEPWIDRSLDKEIAIQETAKLPIDSFPKVYRDFKEAANLAEEYVKRKIEDIERKRENLDTVEQAKKLFYQATPRVESLNNRIQSIPGYMELEAIKRQIQELQAQKERTRAFSFKEKKEIKKSIEKLSAEAQELGRSVDILKNPLDKELQKEKEILNHNQLLAFGCNPEVSLKQINASFCYFYVPNNPPPEPKPSKKEEVITRQVIESGIPTSDNGISNNARKPVFCHKCGAKLLANSSFCSFCGAKLG